MKIGDDFRSTRVAEEYALKLDGRAKNLVHDEDMDAIEALARGYPSHGFVIDRTEAKSLFRRVSPLEGALADVVNGLGAAIMPSPSLRQQSIVQYLNNEVSHEERTGLTDTPPAGGKPSARKKPGDEPTRGEPVPPPPSTGDGNIAIPIPGQQTRPGRQSKTSN